MSATLIVIDMLAGETVLTFVDVESEPERMLYRARFNRAEWFKFAEAILLACPVSTLIEP